MTDSARGGGEYLLAYAYLSGCKSGGQANLAEVFQRKFAQIFGNKGSLGRAIFNSMEQAIKNDSDLAAKCWFGVDNGIRINGHNQI